MAMTAMPKALATINPPTHQLFSAKAHMAQPIEMTVANSPPKGKQK